jgi:hypothetical protein
MEDERAAWEDVTRRPLSARWQGRCGRSPHATCRLVPAIVTHETTPFRGTAIAAQRVSDIRTYHHRRLFLVRAAPYSK